MKGHPWWLCWGPGNNAGKEMAVGSGERTPSQDRSVNPDSYVS